jgi:isochorismate hydrolase
MSEQMNTKARINAPHDGLTRDSTVLLLVDYQVGPLWEPDAMALRRDIVALAGVVSSLGVPTVLTAMACDDWGPIIPELTRATPGAPVIQRSVLDPWSVPRVREAVEETGRTHLVIAGVATEMCVACAALGAARDGYSVYAVLDASGHFSPHAAAAAVMRMRAGGVVVSNCAMILLELVKDDLERGPSALLALSLRHALPQPPAASGTGVRRRRTA